MSKFCVLTFGCRCNQADSAAMREGLCRRAMSECKSHQDADIIIVNTCTVTHRTDQQVRQAVRRLHRENPAARVIVTGCYAERDPETLAALPGVSLVVGNAERDRLPEILDDLGDQSQGKIVRAPLTGDLDCLLQPMAHTGGKTRPLVKLQDGCDCRCAYCIVPYVRGPGRSAHPEEILAEVRSLVEAGFQEIVLTGVNLGTFGRKNKGCTHLIDLLRHIVEIPHLGRIRLSSIEPMMFEHSIIELAASSPAFARHFHIPIQSGSDRILRAMRRPYRAARVRELFLHVQRAIPDVGLGTDVLVGFPGETETDFAQTYEFIRDSPLTYLHVFPFSPREGTEAYSLPDRTPPKAMKERLNSLLEISREKNLAFRQRFLGQILPAITLAKEEDLGESVVLTSNYIHVRVPGLFVAPNRLLNIRIDRVLPAATWGSAVETANG
jgi:threonylcarbamoyladenosine tRNA methylthiotransferase MtaB